jgi:hypothetical protein
VGPRLSNQGARWQSFVRDRASPEGMTRHLGGALPWPSLGGVGPAAHVAYRCVAARRRSCAGASLDRTGAPARQGGSALDRGSHLLHPGAEFGMARRGAAFVVRQHGQ